MIRYQDFRERYVFWGLMISLTLSFTITPFLDENIRPFNIFILFSLAFAVCAIGSTKPLLILGLILGIPFFLASVASATQDHEFFLIGFYCLATLFFSLVISLLLRDIFTNNRINTNRLLSAISIYLCIAIVWSMLYGLVDLYIPYSYNIAGNTDSQLYINDLMYFSIVTLTTLGYGDITPLSNAAKSLAAVEALIGQIYLTVLVARLVGLHIAENSNSPYERKDL